MPRAHVLSAAEAAALIPDGATSTVSASSGLRGGGFDRALLSFLQGGAALPSCPGTNPTLTLWALSYRAAGRLVQRLRRGKET